MPDSHDLKMPTELVLRELLFDRDEEVIEIALAARQAVLKFAPNCSELIYQTYCISNAFSFTHKLGQSFIHIATYKSHVNLGFSRGSELNDPKGLLSGDGKTIRHSRLSARTDLLSPSIDALIKQAVDQGYRLAEGKGGVDSPICIVKRN